MKRRLTPLLCVALLIGCTGKNEPTPTGAATAATEKEQITANLTEVAPDDPSLKWANSSFDALPPVVVSDAPPPPQAFAGEEKPPGTAIPEETQRLLDTYNKKQFDAVKELALTYPQREVRLAAMIKLASLSQDRKPELIPVLRAGMQEQDSRFQAKVLKILHDEAEGYQPSDISSALPEIAAKLQDSHNSSDMFAASTLQAMGPKALPALPQLCWAAQHKVSNSLDAIGAIGPAAQAAIPLVAKLTVEQDSFDGAQALGKLQATDQVLQLLQSDKGRTKALGAAGAKHLQTHSPEMVALLQGALTNGESLARSNAAAALGAVRPSTPEIADILMRVPVDEIPFVNAAIYQAIAGLDPPAPEGLEFLTQRLEQATDENSKEDLQDAITLWKTNNKVPLESLLQDVIASGGKVEGAIIDGANEEFEPLMTLAQDENQPSDIRAAALVALRTITQYIEVDQNDKYRQIKELALKIATAKPDQPLLSAAAHVYVDLEGSYADESKPWLLVAIQEPGFGELRRADTFAVCFQKLPEALPVLVQLLKDRDPDLLPVIVAQIGNYGEAAAAATPELVKLQFDPAIKSNRKLIEDQLASIAKIATPGGVCIAFLEKFLEATDPSDDLYGAGIKSLAKVIAKNGGDPTFVLAKMDEALESDFVVSKFGALQGLVQLGPKGSPLAPKVIPLLDLPVGSMYAVEALEGIGPAAKEAEPKLIQIIDSPQVMPARVLMALGAIHASSPEFFALVEAKYPEVKYRYAILTAIADIGPDAIRLMPLVVQSLESPEDQERISAAKALGSFGPAAKEALPKLKEMAAGDKSYSVKTAAENAVKKIEATPGDNNFGLRGAIKLDLSAEQPRSWTDVTGAAHEGKLVAVSSDVIMIQRKKDYRGGDKLLILLANLSPEDRDYVQAIQDR